MNIFEVQRLNDIMNNFRANLTPERNNDMLVFKQGLEAKINEYNKLIQEIATRYELAVDENNNVTSGDIVGADKEFAEMRKADFDFPAFLEEQEFNDALYKGIALGDITFSKSLLVK